MDKANLTRMSWDAQETCIYNPLSLVEGFPGGSEGEESACNAGDLGSIPGSRRSPREGNGSSVLAWRIPWIGPKSKGL